MRGLIPSASAPWALPLLAAVLPPFAILSSKGVVVLVAACALAIVLARPRVPGKGERPLLLPGLLLAWAMLSLSWANDVGAALAVLRLPLVFLMGLVLYLEVGALTATQRDRLLRFAMWGCLAAISLMAAAYLDNEGVLYAVTGERHWLVKLKPASTVLAILVWPTAAYAWRRWSPVRAGLLICAAFAVLWFGEAKAAKLAMMAGAAIFTLAWVGRRAVSSIIALAVCTLVLFAPLLAAQPERHPEIVTKLPLTAQHRVKIWDFVADRISERPWLGWGYNNSRAIPGGKTSIEYGEILPLHPHNAPLQVWLELGLPGAAATAAILVALLMAVGRFEPLASAGSLAAFASAATVGSLSYGIWQDWWLCCLLFAVVLCRALTKSGVAETPLPGFPPRADTLDHSLGGSSGE